MRVTPRFGPWGLVADGTGRPRARRRGQGETGVRVSAASAFPAGAEIRGSGLRPATARARSALSHEPRRARPGIHHEATPPPRCAGRPPVTGTDHRTSAMAESFFAALKAALIYRRAVADPARTGDGGVLLHPRLLQPFAAEARLIDQADDDTADRTVAGAPLTTRSGSPPLVGRARSAARGRRWSGAAGGGAPLRGPVPVQESTGEAGDLQVLARFNDHLLTGAVGSPLSPSPSAASLSTSSISTPRKRRPRR